MNAEIICVGTELLVGRLINTNAPFLAKQLASIGIDVYYQTVVGDNPLRLAEALRIAAKRADILITVGGLGPTEDDVTVEGWERFLKRRSHFDAGTLRHIQKRLKRRGLCVTELMRKQCRVLDGARVLANRHGTAPGQLINYRSGSKTKWGVLLPGPPAELEPMTIHQALPALVEAAAIRAHPLVVRTLKIAGLTEPQVAERVGELLRLKPPVTLGIYSKGPEVELVIMSKAASLRKAICQAAALEHTIRQRLGRRIYGADGQTLPQITGALLRRRKLTLSVGESCSGGLLAHLLTEIPGSSDTFGGGVVAYDNRVKVNLLGVPPSLIKRLGAVSAEVAAAMASGVRARLKTDIGIGITGIAGPGGATPNKPVGLVYVAIARGRKIRVEENRFLGTRTQIKYRAAHKALELLREVLS